MSSSLFLQNSELLLQYAMMAVRQCRIKPLKKLRDECEEFHQWGDSICNEAAACGHLKILEWTVKNNCSSLTGKTCVIAAENGHLVILEWLVNNGCQFNWWKCRNAAKKRGHQHVTQWISSIMACKKFASI